LPCYCILVGGRAHGTGVAGETVLPAGCDDLASPQRRTTMGAFIAGEALLPDAEAL
jgi:hypothetical protein